MSWPGRTGRAFFRGGFMVLSLFESADQRRRDDEELGTIHRKYGDETCKILQARVNDETLKSRDRKHWARLLRKAKSRFGG